MPGFVYYIFYQFLFLVQNFNWAFFNAIYPRKFFRGLRMVLGPTTVLSYSMKIPYYQELVVRAVSLLFGVADGMS